MVKIPDKSFVGMLNMVNIRKSFMGMLTINSLMGILKVIKLHVPYVFLMVLILRYCGPK